MTNTAWEAKFVAYLETKMTILDAAHDLSHVRRVVAMAKFLAQEEHACLEVVIPAAWLHDCIKLPRTHPQYARESALAAELALAFLDECGYPAQYYQPIGHAIEAHSFHGGIAPQTLEAMVVQDADRLDALGAIGIARTFATGAALDIPLYDDGEPFPRRRTPNDSANMLDHFYMKLLKIAETLHTDAARREGVQRKNFLEAFLQQLRRELDNTGRYPAVNNDAERHTG